jgi:hypothetical protein
VEFGPQSVDRETAGLARRQHGVIATRQLVEFGLSQQAVSHRVSVGRLHRVHHGVYAVAHRARHPRTLDGGGAGVRTGRGAEPCRGRRAVGHPPHRAVIIDVTARLTGRKRPGLRIHRPRRPAETTVRDRIPVTTPARTILDRAATLAPSRLEDLLDRAEIRELTDYPALDARARARRETA